MVIKQFKMEDLKGVPIYVHIREDIREKIHAKEFKVGAFIPAENDIAKLYGASRMTVRRAIDDLVQEGLLIRRQGSGTIVSSTKVVRDYSRLTSFFEDAKNRGMNPKSRLLLKELVSANEDTAKKLMIDPGDALFHLIRLRVVEDNKIIALHNVHIPQSICPWIDDADLNNESLYRLYEEHRIPIEWGRQIVEARAATPEQARLLNVEPGTPLLHSERVSYTNANLPVEYVIAVSPGDCFSMDLVLHR